MNNDENYRAYIQEPTFLSPMNMHYRMMAVKKSGYSHEFPKLQDSMNKETMAYDNAFQFDVNDGYDTYTSKKRR